MTEYAFPERRFVEAGVPTTLVDKMRREFTASDLTIKRALCDFWNPLSASALRDYAMTYTGETFDAPAEVDVASESTQDVLRAPLSAPTVVDDDTSSTDDSDASEPSESDEA
jgi:hypothetical protein